jgi:hypothetical protein
MRKVGTIKGMAKFQHIIGLALICVWISSQALACLPNPQMTHSEMECCKKMAGDCQMGTGQHPCCKTVSSAPASAASIQPVSQVHPVFAVVVEIAYIPVPLLSEGQSDQIGLGLPPPAPPGNNSILRI